MGYFGWIAHTFFYEFDAHHSWWIGKKNTCVCVSSMMIRVYISFNHLGSGFLFKTIRRFFFSICKHLIYCATIIIKCVCVCVNFVIFNFCVCVRVTYSNDYAKQWLKLYWTYRNVQSCTWAWLFVARIHHQLWLWFHY